MIATAHRSVTTHKIGPARCWHFCSVSATIHFDTIDYELTITVIPRAFRSCLTLLLLAVSSFLPSAGAATLPVVAPLPTLADYHHTRWTADEGAPAAIRAMAQTRDGWLWIGTLDGLYRFDGVRFTRYPLPSGLGLNRNLIRYLQAGPRGELYIGRAAEGITVLEPDGRLHDLPPEPVTGHMVDGLAVDADGSVWIVCQGIYRLQDGRWQNVATGPEWKGVDVRSFRRDGQGRLWISKDASTWRLDRAAQRFERILDLGGDLLPAPDGRLWLMTNEGELRALAPAGADRPGAVPEAVSTGRFAPDGSLWQLGCPDQPCVVPGAAQRGQDAFRVGAPPAAGPDAQLRMSGKTPNLLLVDREGATWISSEGGLDRLRRKRILPTELGGVGIGYSVVADKAGRVWAANAYNNRMWELTPERAVPVPTRHPILLLARDPDGGLLYGGKRSVWRETAAGVQEMPLPPGPGGKPIDMRMMGILDDGKLLWTATLETGLLAWRDGQWRPHSDFKLPAKIYQSALAGPGQLWLATGDGELFHYDGATNALRPPVDIRALGMTATIFPGPELVLSGDNGSGVVRAGALAMLRAAEPNVLRNVSGMVTTNDGDRWLNGAAGLVHVTAADWARSIADPAVPLRYEVFDGLDGYPGRAVFENRWRSAWSGDGRTLWLTATGGVVRVDTADLARNRVAPNPVILSLTSEAGTVGVDGAPLRLAPGTERFRVDFTAPSLRMPERVRFEYLLEGVDNTWQDAGTRRSTSYTSIDPGDYVFRLRAINEDGVRSTSEARLALRVEPTLWQTTWFRLLCAGLLVLLLVLAYRVRVRQLTRRVAERLHVKVAERERIARTLHDNFLQTVHSLMLRVDTVAAGLPPDDATRRELESVLRHAGGALGEGREQLQELRSGARDRLEDVLDDCIAQLQAAHPGVMIRLRSEGARRPLEPEVTLEVAAIAREALHNACIHGGAGQVRASLDYSAEGVMLRVADDGRGFDPAVLREGRAQGHWGLVGMRERAQRIGAVLDIADGSEGGAVITLRVPAVLAYLP